MSEWLHISGKGTLAVLISTFLCYVVIICLVRAYEVKSISETSGSDVIFTLIIGFILTHTIVSASTNFLPTIVTISFLFIWKKLFSYLLLPSLRNNSHKKPIIVMQHGDTFDDQLTAANLTRNELFAKLRQANVLSFTQVRAAIVKTTRDLSVLHGAAEVYNDEMLHGTMI